MQYTIRNVPNTLDEALRRAAREQDKSLNEVAIEALARGAGVTGERDRLRDMSDIAGTWRKDPAFDRAVAAQDTIDERCGGEAGARHESLHRPLPGKCTRGRNG